MLKEKIAEDSPGVGKVWRLATHAVGQRSTRGAVSVVTEWERDADGFESYALFSGWRRRLQVVSMARVTQKALERMHAQNRAAAIEAVRARRAELAAEAVQS